MESNKKKERDTANLNDWNRSNSNEVVECQGQELMWVEEQADSVSSPSQQQKTKKIGFRLLGSLRNPKRHRGGIPPDGNEITGCGTECAGIVVW
jgi:hypothetical protein